MARRGVAELPVVCLKDFLGGSCGDACRVLAGSLRTFGAVLVRDPRVSVEDSDEFLDQMEGYFSQSEEEKLRDVRADVNFQVGACPDGTEVPRDHRKYVQTLSPSERPQPVLGADPKWRFFWRIGERPGDTKYPELNAMPVVPRSFANWSTVMDGWGNRLVATCMTVAEMLAVGLGLPSSTILDKLENGPHLLAPTGSDLIKCGSLNTVLAGFHYDLNVLTIHGKSRFPGLYIWTTQGERLACKVPTGCLLVQAGIQLEWLTAGEIRRGYHEVIVDEQALAKIEEAKRNQSSIWRVSSTLFAHVASDQLLLPLGDFQKLESSRAYQPTLAGEQVLEELRAINLATS